MVTMVTLHWPTNDLENNALAIKNAKKLMSDYGDIEENPFFSKTTGLSGNHIRTKEKS